MAAALLFVAGGSIAFASQSLDSGRSKAPTDAPVPPPPPLTILPPDRSITRAASIDLAAVAPDNLRSDQHYVVRVYVNDAPVGRIDLPDEAQFTLPNVPLSEGDNAISVGLVGEGGESPRSAPVAVARDDEAPTIKILEPQATVYTESELLIGRTEAGADIHVVDETGHALRATIGGDGRFNAPLELHVGNNNLMLTSTDRAGNSTTKSVTIVRAQSAATIELTVTPEQIYSANLPVQMSITATLRDDQGQVVPDGTQVIFGVSPPERETTTYAVTTSGGRARFGSLKIQPGDAPGTWLVTALATLPSGIELRADASFSLTEGAPKSPGQR